MTGDWHASCLIASFMDTILPSRFFDRLRKEHEPEKRLMAAVLEDAVQVYRDRATARTARDVISQDVVPGK